MNNSKKRIVPFHDTYTGYGNGWLGYIYVCGYFKDGTLIDGNAIFAFPRSNKTYYAGGTYHINCDLSEVANMERHGYGIFLYEDNFLRYEGNWVKNKRSGYGKEVSRRY